MLRRGSPRENAAAKDSSRAEERQALERSMPSYAEELLLTNESGEVLEGAGSTLPSRWTVSGPPTGSSEGA